MNLIAPQTKYTSECAMTVTDYLNLPNVTGTLNSSVKHLLKIVSGSNALHQVEAAL